MSIFHAHPAPLPLLQLLLFKNIIGWRSGAGEMKIKTNIWIFKLLMDKNDFRLKSDFILIFIDMPLKKKLEIATDTWF